MEELRMGFWEVIGELAVRGIEKANEVAEEKMSDYDDSYNWYSNRYMNMSDEKLNKEVERLKRETGGDRFKKMGKIQAMKDELENRRRY